MTLFLWLPSGAGEVVLSSDTEFDPAQHLTYEDITMDDKQPLVAILSYTAMRRLSKGPLFLFED